MTFEFTCASCGQTFTAASRYAATCSGKCRKRRHDAHRRVTEARRAALAADLTALAHESLTGPLAA
ncbi:hypothetical protein LG299_02690 [Microbacterium lacus]|uniref:hypothetical protein n=1 Tax=Microbacterium lacus TaxID=415217 RepID=UPI00384BA63F